MINFIQTTPYRNDCTCNYDLELDREYTVREFIKEIFERRPREWGYIGIKNEKLFDIFGDPKCKYRSTEITTLPLPDYILDSTIATVSASGGWSSIDYLINLKIKKVVSAG